MSIRYFFIIIIFVLLAAVLFFAWHYFFSIYEVYYDVSPQSLSSDGTSEVKIKSVPLNALGTQVPFRSSPIEYEIEEGTNLIDVISFLPEKGFLQIKAKGQEGKVVVKIKSVHSLLPTLIEIPIVRNSA